MTMKGITIQIRKRRKKNEGKRSAFVSVWMEYIFVGISGQRRMKKGSL